MIKSILKANSWYDDLKEPNRTLFFFFVLIPLICGSQLLLTTIFIRNMHKKRKNLEKDLNN